MTKLLRLFPKLWFTILIVFTIAYLVQLAGFINGGKGEVGFLIMGAIVVPLMYVIGGKVFKSLTANLVDEVQDNGDHLKVITQGIDSKILFSDIKNVSYNNNNNQPMIRLLVNADGGAREVAFVPRHSPLSFGTINDLALSLIERAEKAKRT